MNRNGKKREKKIAKSNPKSSGNINKLKEENKEGNLRIS